MKAIIWGSSGSLPCPITSAYIKEKMETILWEARAQQFTSREEVSQFVSALPHSASGTFKGNTSCVQIEADTDDVIICDAGTGLRDYSYSISKNTTPRTYHFFISHLHWDHIQGLPFFAPLYQPGNKIIFHGFHKGTEEILRTQMTAPGFPVEFDYARADIEFDIRETGDDFTVGSVQIATIEQQHPGKSWGYAFKQGDKKIIYSSDSEHHPESVAQPDYPFVEFFRDADVLIFDGQYTHEEAINEKRDWGHSDHITAVELAHRAKVKKLVIFHHEPTYTDINIENTRQDALKHLNSISDKTAGASNFPKELILSYDGLVIEA